MSDSTDFAVVFDWRWTPVAEQRVERNDYGQYQSRWVWCLPKAQREALEAEVARGAVLKALRRDPASGKMLLLVKLARAGR